MRGYCGFSLHNVFCEDKFKNLKAMWWKIAKHKVIELEFLYYKPMIIELGISIKPWRMDHAGCSVEIGLLRYSVQLQYYDTRHWDDETNDWEKYDEEESRQAQ